jgi:C-terminal processing protease CtpA/Prc
MQYPTGRPESPSGEVIIEGKGIIPDFIVPVTEESALGGEDTILLRAIKELLDKIN